MLQPEHIVPLLQMIGSLFTPEAAEAALVPTDALAARAIKTAKHDPELHREMQQAQRRKETATVKAAKGEKIGADYKPATKEITVDPKKVKDPGYLAHEVMHFLSQVSRSPFWHPLRVNEYLAEYAGTAGHAEEADPGYQYGKLPKRVQQGLRQEYQREMAMPRDYVRPKRHEGTEPAMPARPTNRDLVDFVNFWLKQRPLAPEPVQPVAID